MNLYVSQIWYGLQFQIIKKVIIFDKIIFELLLSLIGSSMYRTLDLMDLTVVTNCKKNWHQAKKKIKQYLFTKSFLSLNPSNVISLERLAGLQYW